MVSLLYLGSSKDTRYCKRVLHHFPGSCCIKAMQALIALVTVYFIKSPPAFQKVVSNLAVFNSCAIRRGLECSSPVTSRDCTWSNETEAATIGPVICQKRTERWKLESVL